MKLWLLRHKHQLIQISKILISIASLYYLITKLWQFDYHLFTQQLQSGNQFWLFFLVTLMPVNWFLEALKWKFSTRSIGNISSYESIRHVCIGIAVGFTTPARLGELAGKAALFEDKKKAALIATANSLSQSAATFNFGLTGLIFFIANGKLFHVEFQVINLTIAISFFLLFFFLAFLFRKKIKDEYSKLLNGKLFLLLTLSSFRYIVFILQFYFCFLAFNLSLHFFSLTMAIGLYYLLNSIVPVFTVAEAGLKASIAAFVFPFVDIQAPLAMIAALSIWFVNLVPPVLLGIYWMFRIKKEISKH